MNENELEMTEIADDTAKENAAAVTADLSETDESAVAEMPLVQDAEVASPCEIGEEDAKKLTAHPMFVHFARGRRGTFDEICRDFQAMLSAEEISAKMTPTAAQASYDVALSERQRAIARAAGMTYREYYNILNGR